MDSNLQNLQSFVFCPTTPHGFLLRPGILVIIDRKRLKRMKLIGSYTLYHTVTQNKLVNPFFGIRGEVMFFNAIERFVFD